ncbi:MAG: tetratricopeptide repeat protein [Bacteroidota bacterium]
MKNILLSVLFLLIICHFAFATQNNSSTDLDKVHEQYNLGHQQGNPELVKKAIQDCNELVSAYHKNNDHKNLAKAYTLLGKILVENGKFSESKDILIKAFDLSNKEFGSDADETMEAKKYLSWAYGYLGDADMELMYSNELLETYKKNKAKYSLEIADLYNTIGMNYGSRNDRAKEREYLFNSQKMLEDYNPKNEEENLEVQTLLMNVLNSLSLSFIGSIDYKNAIIYAKNSLQISGRIAPNSPERTPTMVVMARCYILERKCDSAIFYMDNALNLLEANNLKGSTMWLSYRSYKVNMLARCGNGDKANSEARNTIKILLAQGDTPEEALSQLLILSQNINAELTSMENNYREKEAIATQRQTKERFMLFGIICVLLLISGVGFGIYKNRQTKKEIEFQKKELAFQKIENQHQNDLLQQRNEIRKRISFDLHDEIGSGLTQISMMCFQCDADLKKQKPIEKTFLEKVSSESRTLSENLSELIWATMPDNDNLSSLFTKIRTYSNNFSENVNINLQLNISDTIEPYPTHPEANRNICLILKEGLNNIAKHSNADKIEIDFSVDTEKNFKLFIADNGKGFDTTIPTNRNGTKSLENRATSIKNGRFELKSEIGKGTFITAEGNLS